ncbi:ShlB/FhaC/HecB family hemolysin secretion/activation protein [Salmonella enterica subsp. enterica serovar Miami]|uniref:ShlB/FhaC/HecB family hemolysin secretion/activation protein n=2 Tax=Salmonella enterica TaxID=28901 RepID=UPI0003BCE585|nr:ShlB/FhaC/HecB family hemolysin secretion/activation protein [Salmonella enterica subsp. enterica serovar Newport]EAN8326092.1 ShlB/FhaC/HecB family hemolysin secretion/activation protein [Salmonella enterica]EBR9315103.1 ShlB/FhaC/HecB family hemolysin secretion/activation protein [Salmonella enterica subsp. enterica serovar Muenchen]EBV3722102.1 ShlB/FhaC/HecB family hemolysin secretion/activation protein [Salmonella enterica subsp. enterica serovar Oranienburg]EDQ3991985.1 ShlB/FhaC/HecB 
MNILRSRDAFSRPDKLIFILAPLALIVASVCAQAAGPDGPGAGTLGNQLRQEKVLVPAPPVNAPLVLPEEGESRKALSSDSHTTVVVKKVVFTGLPDGFSGLSEQVLQEQVSDDLNRSLTFAGLEAMVQKVTDLYRHNGLLVARAILPPQTVKDGVLTIEIIPGRYDSEQITNTSALRDSVAQRLVQTTTSVGGVVTRNQLEREALLLSEIPGVNAQLAMKAGRQQGTTTPEITLTPGQRFGGYVGLDNQGDPTTGRSRVMAGGYANNLLGLGDQLRMDILDAFEKSDLFSGSLDYSLLAGGGYGTRVGANYSHLNYRYNLNKLGFKGYSDNWGLYVTQPWIRTSRARVDVRLDGGQQFLTDNYPEVLATESGSSRGRKTVSLGTLSVSGSVAGLPGGLTGFGVSGSAGNVDLRSDISRSFSQQAGSGGQFARLNWQLNHDQQVWGPFSVYAGIKGQLADGNLDASQKFLMGGPSAVRAYDIGDGSVDHGVVGTAEVRSRWGIPVQGWLGNGPQLTVATFYDQGRGQQYRNNRGADGRPLASGNNHNSLNLAGAGLYATVADAGSYALTLTWAHRTGNADPNAVHSDHDRFWVSAVKTF